MAWTYKTLSAQSTIIDTTVDSDATITSAINSGVSISTIYTVSVIPISNTKARILLMYSQNN